MLTWILSVVAALLLSAAPATAQEGRRVALVIGNDTYQSLAPLDNPRLDAGRLAALLDASGFDVVRCDGQRPGCFNLSRDGLEAALEALRRKANGAELALVFYAGHGMEGSRGNVLAPIDTEVSDCTERALRRAVSLSEVFNAVAGARRKIVILDACRNNPFAQCPPARGSRPVSFGDFSVSEVESFLLVSSTKPGQTASDGHPGTHSPFARALLRWLEQAPQVQFHQVLSHVAKEVIEDTARNNDTQVPEMVVRGGGAEGCLKGADCAGDLHAAALKQELDALKEAHKDDRKLAETVKGFLAQAEKGRTPSEEELRQAFARFKEVGDLLTEVEKGRGQTLSSEEKAQEFAGLMEAGRALLALKDTRAARALERLKAGDETEAKRLLAEAAAARQEAAKVAQSRAGEENREAAKALRHLAAIARPRNVAEAADHYKEAVRLDPADAPTWIDYGRAANAAGRIEEAKSAMEQADAKARESGDVLVQIRAAQGLGDLAPARTASEERHYRSALALAERAAQADPGNMALQRALGTAHNRIGGMLFRQGDLSAALESHKADLAIAESLAKADPANGDLQRNLAATHIAIGDVLGEQRSFDRALASYREALAIVERLVKAEPNNTEWLFVLRNSHASAARALQEEGDLASALAKGQEALALAERLGQSDPSNAIWLMVLGFDHTRMGFLLERQGNRAGALSSYQAARAAEQRLTKTQPDDPLFQRNLAVTLSAIGRLLREQGDFAGALESYQATLAVYQGLVTAAPADPGRNENVAFTHLSIGGVFKAQGDLAGALASYRAAVEHYGKVERQKPLALALLAGTHSNIGEVLRKQGDLSSALASYRAALTVSEQQSRADPGNADWQERLALAQMFVGDVLRAQGDLAGALANYRAALPSLGKTDPADKGWQGVVAEAHSSIGGVLREQGRLTDAPASYHDALAIRDRLAKAEPADSRRQVDLGVAHGNVAAVLEAQNDLGGALAGYRAALDINERLAKADPGNADWQSNVFVWHSKVGGALLLQGNLAGALSSHRTALGIAERFTKLDPASADWQQRLAWSHSNVAAARYAKGDRVGALAGWRIALAIAEARAGAVEQEEIKSAGKPGKKTAESLGSLAYHALYARDFRKALAAGERAHTLASDLPWIDFNRATAMLFLKRPLEARARYLAHKGKSTLNDAWEILVAEAFRNLRRAGLAHPMMRQVEAALGVAPQSARPSAGVRRANK